ncbi:hypothetical protein PIB30_054358, partial [Stylosanthes scabra]|nr:hypothetical protein [Stylosanthes scabra]
MGEVICLFSIHNIDINRLNLNLLTIRIRVITLQEKPPIATLLKRAEKGVKSAPIVLGHAFSPTGTLFVGSRLSAWRLLYRYAFQRDPRSASTATLKREPTCGCVTLLYMRYGHAFKRSYEELLPRFNERSHGDLWPRFIERGYEE